MKSAMLILGLAAAVLAGGCATTRNTEAPEAAQVDAMNAGVREVCARSRIGPNTHYVIDPPDVIAIYVKDNKDLSQDALVVGPDGYISLPLVDTVRVAGRTVEEVQTELRQKYSKFIRDAVVTVRVTAFHSKWLYVDGEVLRPGRYPYTGSDSVVNAIAQAGFLTKRASPNGIHVSRGNPNDPEIYPVRLKDIIIDDDSRTNWQLNPEDIVYVPPSFLSRIGYIFEEILFPFQSLTAPASSYATYKYLQDD